MDQQLFVHVHHLLRRTFVQKIPLVQEDHPVAVLRDAAQVMAHDQDRLALGFEFFKLVKTLCLEKNISYGKRLIHDQDLRIDIDGNGEGQTHEHSAGIGLDRLVNEVSDVRERKNAVQPGVDLFLRKADHGPVQIYIFKAGILPVEAGSQLQKRRDPSVYGKSPLCGSQYTGDDLQEGGFSGSVHADDPDTFPFLYGKIDIPQCVMLPVPFFSGKPEGFLQPVRGLVI